MRGLWKADEELDEEMSWVSWSRKEELGDFGGSAQVRRKLWKGLASGGKMRLGLGEVGEEKLRSGTEAA